MSETLARLRKRYGMTALLARELKISEASVYDWKAVPLKHVFHVAKITGLKPETLRPDFFAHDPLRN